MRQRLVSCLLFAFFAPAGAFACSCVPVGPALCRGLTPNSVIFVGTVMRIDNPPREDGGKGESGVAHYRFHIDEKIVGTQDQEIDIYSTRGGADCSYHFQQGRKYVVSPYKGANGHLFATICSVTRPIELAQPFLTELRAMRDHQPVASLYGILRSAEKPYWSVTDDPLGKPLANTEVEIRSGTRIFNVKTEFDGYYAFYGVPEGEYKITAALPPNLEIAQMILDDPMPRIKLPSGACYEFDVTAYPTGSVRGRVAGPDGNPLVFASLELFRPEKYADRQDGISWMEFQDIKKGYFQFNHVGPGDYVLVYNDSGEVSTDTPFPRTFYPGVPDLEKAGRIHLEAGAHLTGVDFRVTGGKPTREIKVRLAAEAGNLPNIHYVETVGEDGSSISAQEVSPDVYEISLFKDMRYKMHGEGRCSTTNTDSQTDSVRIDGADDSVAEFTLIFRGAGCRE